MERCAPGAAHARVLRVRISTEGAQPSAGQIGTIAAQAGATFPAGRRDARFAVADDAGATRLIAALVNGGLAVIEAGAEESRLERLFTEPRPERRRERHTGLRVPAPAILEPDAARAPPARDVVSLGGVALMGSLSALGSVAGAIALIIAAGGVGQDVSSGTLQLLLVRVTVGSL